MLRTRSRRVFVSAASLLTLLLSAPTASADLWGVSDWGTLVWGEGAASVPALGSRELLVLAAAVLSTGIVLTRRMLNRKNGEKR
jgi:hypothetical protein